MPKINLRQIGTSEDQKKMLDKLEQEILDLLERTVVPPSPFIKGRNYLVLTINRIFLGKVKKTVGQFLVLENAYWVSDAGKWHNFIMGDETSSTVEKFRNDLLINTSTITDATEWDYEINFKEEG